MPDVYGPFDGSAYQQAPWYRDHGYLDLSGVRGGAAVNPTSSVGDLALTTAGLTSSIGLGRAHVRGASYERTGTAWTYTHPANTDPTNYRIDRIVLRRDLGAKTVLPAVLQGVPASTPAAPALTQVEDGIWELPLHYVTVPPASGTTLTPTDERYWLPGRSGIPAGQNLPGDTLGQYRDHPSLGLQRYNSLLWKKIPGIPSLIASGESIGAGSAVAPGGTGFVISGALTIPAHNPGLLLLEGLETISPAAIGTPIAGYVQIGIGPTTGSLAMLGGRTRFHNNSNTWSNYVPCQALYDSDGTAKVAAFLGWSDPGSGTNFSTLGATLRCWQL